jgi:hypothetical protein
VALTRDDAIAVEFEIVVMPLHEHMNVSTPVASLKRRRRILQARRDVPGLDALLKIGVMGWQWADQPVNPPV